jgi:hypothetical protein
VVPAYVITAVKVVGDEVVEANVELVKPRPDGTAGLLPLPEGKTADDVHGLMQANEVFVVHRVDADAFELGSRVRWDGRRLVSVDKNGVEDGALLALPRFH